MCELFAMCSRNEADVSFSLHTLAEHGSQRAPHKDGWGIAYYVGNDASGHVDNKCPEHFSPEPGGPTDE